MVSRWHVSFRIERSLGTLFSQVSRKSNCSSSSSEVAATAMEGPRSSCLTFIQAKRFSKLANVLGGVCQGTIQTLGMSILHSPVCNLLIVSLTAGHLNEAMSQN